jgi:hypothetical protein
MSTRGRSRNSSDAIESPEVVSTESNTHAARVSRRHRSPVVILAPQSSDVVLTEEITDSVLTRHHSSSPRGFSEVHSQQLQTNDTTSPVPCIVQQQQNQPFLSNTVTSNVHQTPSTSIGAATSPSLPLLSESNNIAAVNGAASSATSNTNAFQNRNHTHSVMVCNVCMCACACVICCT